mmetsp:Transcript_23579/g.73391  ORF Transcript_23579/g.73391 Transcript_23579/m.73391 type:complete len:322 (+) Transcript_23579:397-1362(+)
MTWQQRKRTNASPQRGSERREGARSTTPPPLSQHASPRRQMSVPQLRAMRRTLPRRGVWRRQRRADGRWRRRHAQQRKRSSAELPQSALPRQRRPPWPRRRNSQPALSPSSSRASDRAWIPPTLNSTRSPGCASQLARPSRQSTRAFELRARRTRAPGALRCQGEMARAEKKRRRRTRSRMPRAPPHTTGTRTTTSTRGSTSRPRSGWPGRAFGSGTWPPRRARRAPRQAVQSHASPGVARGASPGQACAGFHRGRSRRSKPRAGCACKLASQRSSAERRRRVQPSPWPCPGSRFRLGASVPSAPPLGQGQSQQCAAWQGV